MLVTQDRFKTLLLCHAMVTILVPFGAPHGRPHNPSSSNFHQVIKDLYPMHQELLNATSPTILAQFIKEILILHSPLPWVKGEKKSIFRTKKGV